MSNGIRERAKAFGGAKPYKCIQLMVDFAASEVERAMKERPWNQSYEEIIHNLDEQLAVKK